MGQHKAFHPSALTREPRRQEALLLMARTRAKPGSLERLAPGDIAGSSTPPGGVSDADFNRSILEASVDCIKVLSLNGLVHSMNEKGRCLMEIDDLDQIKDQAWIEFWSHDQRPAVQQAMDAARSGGVGRFDGYRPTLNGTPQWWDVVVSPMRDAGGTPTHLVAVSRDVTTARHQAEAGDLLNLELSHRNKNLFALVNGLITLAARRDQAVQPFADTLRERFTALSRALDYVLPSHVVTAPTPPSCLHGLLWTLLSPYEDSAQSDRRFVILGDNPRVGPKATTNLALSVHELATNAVKYGALSNPEGRVTITCRCKPSGECELVWCERGGPVVAAAPERTGFGSKLLRRSVKGALGGRVTKRWDQKGLTLRLNLPLTLLSQ